MPQTHSVGTPTSNIHSTQESCRVQGPVARKYYVSASPLADLNFRGSALTGCKKKLALEVHLTCT